MTEDEKFVRAWFVCRNVTEVSRVVQRSYQGTVQKASLLRKAGVRLPYFEDAHRATNRTDVKGLNQLVARLATL